MTTQHTVADTEWTAEHGSDAAVFVLAHHPDPALVGLRRVLGEGERWVIGRGRSVLGAGVLDDPRISGEHAVIGMRRGAVVVRDLDSRNGTKVNGVRVDSCQLHPGDVLGLGSAVWVLSSEPAERPALAAPSQELVGVSWALHRVQQQIEQVAPTDATVLVLGEPGVGKELVARAVHAQSGRAGQLLSLNCGAVNEQLLQSELFGHVRGAFSGAGKARPGLVASARGGTLFLDEIGDASPGLQVSLLRLLENGEYRPVGSDRVEHAEVRVVAATNRLEAGADQGQLRADLHGRLSRWVIQVPPLRHRREDIPTLAAHFASAGRGAPTQLDHRLALALCLHGWPGNVRELAAVIERLMVECGGVDKLRPSAEQLKRLGLGSHPAPRHTPSLGGSSSPSSPRPERPDAERLEAAFVACGGSMKALANRLGVGRNTLYRWFAAAGLDPKQLRETHGL